MTEGTKVFDPLAEISQLKDRIALLEQRIANLEQGQKTYWPNYFPPTFGPQPPPFCPPVLPADWLKPYIKKENE